MTRNNLKYHKKVKCDGRTDRRTDQRTDGWTDGPTKRVVELHSTRLKTLIHRKERFFKWKTFKKLIHIHSWIPLQRISRDQQISSVIGRNPLEPIYGIKEKGPWAPRIGIHYRRNSVKSGSVGVGFNRMYIIYLYLIFVQSYIWLPPIRDISRIPPRDP